MCVLYGKSSKSKSVGCDAKSSQGSGLGAIALQPCARANSSSRPHLLSPSARFDFVSTHSYPDVGSQVGPEQV